MTALLLSPLLDNCFVYVVDGYERLAKRDEPGGEDENAFSLRDAYASSRRPAVAATRNLAHSYCPLKMKRSISLFLEAKHKLSELPALLALGES